MNIIVDKLQLSADGLRRMADALVHKFGTDKNVCVKGYIGITNEKNENHGTFCIDMEGGKIL